MSGMKENPGEAYRLLDRFTCAKCGCTPAIEINGTNDLRKITRGSFPLHVKVTCHGEVEERMIDVNEIVYDHYFFQG